MSCPIDDSIIFIRYRYGNIYIVDLNYLSLKNDQCLVAINTKNNKINWLWYRKLGYTSMDLLSKHVKRYIVKCLLKQKFKKNHICNTYQFEK